MNKEFKSKITGLEYNANEVVKIINTKQAMLYLKNNCTLYDLYVINDNLAFIFSKEESRPLYELWNRRELS